MKAKYSLSDWKKRQDSLKRKEQGQRTSKADLDYAKMATQVTREGIIILGPSVRQYRQDGRPPVAALTKTVKRSTKGAVQRMQNHHSISKEMGRTPLKAPSAEISSLDHLETRVDKSNSRNMKSVSRPRHAMRSFAVCRRLICSCNRAAVHGQETTERAQAYSNLDSSSS